MLRRRWPVLGIPDFNDPQWSETDTEVGDVRTLRGIVEMGDGYSCRDRQEHGESIEWHARRAGKTSCVAREDDWRAKAQPTLVYERLNSDYL